MPPLPHLVIFLFLFITTPQVKCHLSFSDRKDRILLFKAAFYEKYKNANFWFWFYFNLCTKKTQFLVQNSTSFEKQFEACFAQMLLPKKVLSLCERRFLIHTCQLFFVWSRKTSCINCPAKSSRQWVCVQMKISFVENKVQKKNRQNFKSLRA